MGKSVDSVGGCPRRGKEGSGKPNQRVVERAGQLQPVSSGDGPIGAGGIGRSNGSGGHDAIELERGRKLCGSTEPAGANQRRLSAGTDEYRKLKVVAIGCSLQSIEPVRFMYSTSQGGKR